MRAAQFRVAKRAYEHDESAEQPDAVEGRFVGYVRRNERGCLENSNTEDDTDQKNGAIDDRKRAERF